MPTPKILDRLRLAKRALVGTFDADSAKVAWGMLSGIFPGAAGTPPTRGTEEYLKAYSTMPWLRAVASRVASSTASTEWQLFVARRNGGKAVRMKGLQRASFPVRKSHLAGLLESGELQKVEDHPLLDLLDAANPMLTGLAARKVTQLYLDIVGEAFWLKERDGLGTPVGIWPIPPNWIMSTPTPSKRSFRVSFRGWQGEIPDTEFVWFADPDPWNPYGRGTGTARALADELETDEYAAKFTRQRFFNSARPDFLVFPKGTDAVIKDSEVTRLQQRWTDEHQGFWRQFKPMFLSREVGIHEFGAQDFRELQMVQLRQHERDTIIQTFGGFPPEMLGIHESSNRSMIEAASFMFSLWTLVPRMEFQRAVLQERLVPEYDERLILDYVSPVPEDREFALKAAMAAPWAPTVDEWRTRFQGLPEKEDGSGKVHMVPFSVTPTADLGGVPPPVDVPVLPPSRFLRMKFDPDQPRDENGRWSSGFGSVAEADEWGRQYTDSLELSDSQKLHLKGYKNTSYQNVNHQLREGTTGLGADSDAKAKKSIQEIDSALKNAKLDRDLVVYRGINHPDLAKNAAQMVGKTMDSPAYISTSLDAEFVSKNYVKGKDSVGFSLRVPKGTNGIYMEGFWNKGGTGEAEVLLGRGHKMKVVEAGKRKGKTWIVAELVPAS